MRRALIGGCLVLAVGLLWASPSSADGKAFGFRTSFQTGVMVSRDQLVRLGYDHYGWLGELQLVHAPRSWLDLQLGVVAGMFPASRGLPPGGLVAPLAGALVHTPGKRLSPYAFVDLGPAFTGESVRPIFRLGAGIDIGVRRGVRLGPAFGYARITQRSAPGLSQDAAFLFAGISLSYHPEPPPPPRPKYVTVNRHFHRNEVVIQQVQQVTVEQPAVSTTSDEEISMLLESALPSPTERVELIAPVLFPFDSDSLEPQAIAMLHEVARVLRERAEFSLVAIEGYSDTRGGAEYNRALAERRAQRVRGWLVEHGISAERLVVRAEGATQLVEQGAQESAHEQNRRVVFRVIEQRGK